MADTISARPSRAEEVRQERRRKPGTLADGRLKLSTDESKLDRKTYHYRWASDKGARVQQLTANDYDVVSGSDVKPDGNGLGSVVNAFAGVDDGKPYNHVLMRKRLDWFEEDQKEKQKPLDDQDEAIRRGKDHKANDLRGSGVYTPDQGNSIERA